MLTIKLTSCRECALIPNVINSIECKLASMAKNLYTNIAYMLDKPVEANKMSTLLHYKRILEFKLVNEDYSCDFSVEAIASRVNLLTAGCSCCEEKRNVVLATTTTTTTAAPIVSFTISNLSTKDVGCIRTPDTPAWYTPQTPGELTAGDVIYTDAGGTIPFVGDGALEFHVMLLDTITQSAEVSINGVVGNTIQTC